MCVIAIDFDGTISADFEKAAEALTVLRQKGHKIVIWSSRNNPRQHGIESKELLAQMQEQLDKHMVPYDEIDYGENGKFHAQVYIDDKAWRFESNWDDILNKIY
jgi:predicted mannosyl-3-phosphoglycerate phosphatase (HAD superfamily)